MKKKILFTACAWLLCMGHAWADELVINDVNVPQGGTAELAIGYNFTSTSAKVGFTFSLALPEGITFVTDEDGEPEYVKDASINKLNIICAGEGNFAGQPATGSATIKGTNGTLLTLKLKADATLSVGSTHTVNVTKASFQEKVDGSVKDINLDDFTFTVTVVADPSTGIEDVSNRNVQGGNTVFDLQGRRITKYSPTSARRGILIRNGQKVVR